MFAARMLFYVCSCNANPQRSAESKAEEEEVCCARIYARRLAALAPGASDDMSFDYVTNYVFVYGLFVVCRFACFLFLVCCVELFEFVFVIDLRVELFLNLILGLHLDLLLRLFLLVRGATGIIFSVIKIG